MAGVKFEAPRAINPGDKLDAFDCGLPALNHWLKQRALNNELTGGSRTYVVTETGRVVAYYCLASGAVHHEEAPGSIRRNMPEPIPAMILGRLAVDLAYQKQGLGPALLQDAMERAQEAARILGLRALIVHAKDERAAHFYKRFGFVASPINPLMLMVRVAAK